MGTTLRKGDRRLPVRQVAWTLVLLLTVALALVGIVYAMTLDDLLACPTPGVDSNWGTLSWSALPPGPQCTFTEELNGIDRVEGPGPGMSIWLVALVALSVGLMRQFRRTFLSIERYTVRGPALRAAARIVNDPPRGD